MPQSRRSRRRYDRQRAKRRSDAPVQHFTPLTRGLLLLGAVLLVGGGIALLAGGSSTNASRLGRVGGILMVFGAVMAYAGIRGRL
jgi:hypothetical protein